MSVKHAHASARCVGLAVLGAALSMVAMAGPTAVSVGDSSVSAQVSDTLIYFPVTRSGDLSYDAFVGYHTINGSAVAGTDYIGAVGTLKMPAGVSRGSIPVTIKGSAASAGGPNKTFTLSLDNAVGVGPQARFASQKVFGTGKYSWVNVLADFNGDGKPDLVISNTTDNTLSVLLNNTVAGSLSASFAPAQTVAGGGFQLAVADFNGDGKPDLVSASAVLLNTTNTGSSTLSFAPGQDFYAGQEPFGVAVGDFNGDGKPDVAVSDFDSSGDGLSRVYVILNTTAPGASTASFANPMPFPLRGGLAQKVAVSDVNGDGRPDLLVGDNGSISVLLNTTPLGAGTPSFAPAFAVVDPLGFGEVLSLVAVDVSGDGRPDLVCRFSDQSAFTVFVNTTAPGATTPSFAPAQTISLASPPDAMETLDVNGDGKPDFVYMTILEDYSVRLMVVRNTTIVGSPNVSFEAPTVWAVGNSDGGLAVGDINGDGKADVVATDAAENAVSVLMNTTPAPAPAPQFDIQNLALFVGQTASLVSADFNNDGKMDFAAGLTSECGVPVALNTTVPGASTISFGPLVAFNAGCGQVAVADFNNDGKPDLVTGHVGGIAVYVLPNQTAPGAATPSFGAYLPFLTGNRASAVATGDVNGDGKPDIVAGNNADATISVLLNTTANVNQINFATQKTFGTGLDPLFVALADLNGDGRPDALVGTAVGVSVLINTTPAGASTPAFADAVTIGGGHSFNRLALADVNGDGKLDLVGTEFLSNHVWVWINTTTPGSLAPGFTAGTSYQTGTELMGLTLADVDGNGLPDIVVASSGAGLGTDGVSLLLNKTVPGSTTPSFVPQTFVTNTPSGLTVADFNGDGRPEILVTYAEVTALLNIQYQTALGTSTAAGSIHLQDAQPAAFSFKPVSNAPLSTVETSNSIGVSGITVAVGCSINGGLYSVNGGAYTSAAGTVKNGDQVTVQQTSSASRSTTTTATLTLGSGATAVSAAFGVTTIPPPPAAPASLTASPSAGSVALSWSAPAGAQSYNIYKGTAAGGEGSTPVLSNVTTTSATVSGLTSGAAYYFVVTAVGLGGESARSNEASATLPPPDTTPDAFSFIAVTNAPLSTLEKSNSITVSGINAPVNISISNGQYSINNGAFTSAAGTVGNGAQVTVQVTSSASYGTRVLAPLTIGKGGASFSVTTLPPDITPNAFSFTPITNAPLSTLETSSAVTVSGLGPDGASIAVGGGSYSKNGGTFTSAAGTVKNGEVIRVQLMSSASHKTALTAIVKIGTVSGAFSVTTN